MDIQATATTAAPMTSTTFNDKPFLVQSPDVTYTDSEMVSKYTYQVSVLFLFRRKKKAGPEEIVKNKDSK